MVAKKVKAKLNGSRNGEKEWLVFREDVDGLPLNIQLVELYNFLDGADKAVRPAVIERIKEVEAEIANEASLFLSKGIVSTHNDLVAIATASLGGSLEELASEAVGGGEEASIYSGPEMEYNQVEYLGRAEEEMLIPHRSETDTQKRLRKSSEFGKVGSFKRPGYVSVEREE